MAKRALTPAAFSQWRTEVQADSRRRSAVMSSIEQKGFRQTAEEYFELQAHQVRELDLIKSGPKGVDDLVGRAFLIALETGSPIKIVHEGHRPPNLRIEIGLGGKDGYGVTVYC